MSDRVAEILLDSFSKILIPGLTATITLAVISFAIALVIAVAVALVQCARVPVLTQIARFYIWIVRGAPLLVQLYVVFYGLPDFGIVLDPFPSAVIVFSINTGAYSAETIRGALESVPAGQLEAGGGGRRPEGRSLRWPARGSVPAVAAPVSAFAPVPVP